MDRPDDYDIYLNRAMQEQEEQHHNDLQQRFKEPYSKEDYEDAKSKGLDLDYWGQYCEYYGLDD